jgi:Xaa-Pro dipeptidase
MLANISRLKEAMVHAGLDGIIASSAANVSYLTGIDSVAHAMFGNEACFFAIARRDDPGRVGVIASRCEIDQVLDATVPVQSAIPFGEFWRRHRPACALTQREQLLKAIAVDMPVVRTWHEALAQGLKELGLAGATVGFDICGAPQNALDMLRTTCPRASFQPCTDMLRWVRRVKTQEEINRIRRAAEITELAIQAAIGSVPNGTTAVQMRREFASAVAGQGATPQFTLIHGGRSAVGGQTLPNDQPLARGDILWFDVGILCAGYWSDIARTFSIGPPTDHAARVYAALLAGEEAAIDRVRPGMAGSEVFDIVMQATRDAGLPDYERHHVGHAIGLEVYEQPLLAPGVCERVELGMVLNVETPYYEFGVGALHVEDPVLVAGDGNRLLTGSSRQLEIVD